MSQQCALAAKRANHMASQSKEVVLLAYLALLWPHLEYCVQFWTLQYKNGVKILECVQRRADNSAGRHGEAEDTLVV